MDMWLESISSSRFWLTYLHFIMNYAFSMGYRAVQYLHSFTLKPCHYGSRMWHHCPAGTSKDNDLTMNFVSVHCRWTLREVSCISLDVADIGPKMQVLTFICEYKSVYTKLYYQFFYILIKKKQIFPHFAFLKGKIPFRTAETSDLTLALGWPWSALTGGVERQGKGRQRDTGRLYYGLLMVKSQIEPLQDVSFILNHYIIPCYQLTSLPVQRGLFSIPHLSQSFVAPITAFLTTCCWCKIQIRIEYRPTSIYKNQWAWWDPAL